MNYIEAKSEIKTKYKTRTISNDVEQIVINKLLDDYNLYFVVLKQESDGVYLTDYAKNCDVLKLSSFEVKPICEKHNIHFNNNCLKTKYKSLKDLENFIKCLDELSK